MKVTALLNPLWTMQCTTDSESILCPWVEGHGGEQMGPLWGFLESKVTGTHPPHTHTPEPSCHKGSLT